jgi:hypothetical protein
MDGGASWQDVHSSIYETFIKCRTQRVALDTVITEILNGDLLWSMNDAPGTTQPVEPTSKESKIWKTFIRRLLLQLCVFGFAAYRIVRVREAKRRNLEFKGEHTKHQRESLRIDVANSQLLELTWSKETVSWELKTVQGVSAVGTQWHLTVHNEPYRVGASNAAIPSSCAARAYTDSVALQRLHENLMSRDALNTEPGVYTQPSKQMMGGSARPLYDGPDRQMNVLGETRHDFSSWLATRLDTFKKLDAMSKQAREATRGAYTPYTTALNHDAAADLPPPPPRPLREYMVTDGRDATEMTHRRGPEELLKVKSQLRHQIMFSWQLPPQVLGENINTER